MALAKAVIEIIDKADEKVIPVMFNPNEYKISKQVNYGNIDVQSIESKMLTYQNGDPKTLSLELFFDIEIGHKLEIAENEDIVRIYSNKIMDLTSCGKNRRPPLCRFKWGKLIFIGYIKSVDQSFTRFNSNGIPIRAVINISMIEYYLPTNKSQFTFKDVVNTIEDLYNLVENPADWRKALGKLNIINPRKLK